MTRVVIIDDEPLARNILREYLKPHAGIEVVGECGDGFEGVKVIAQLKPELIFLDVQMPKITGFEMLELIDSAPGVIFTTAFDEYAMQAFERHAVDYLLKPFSQDRFNKALAKWSSRADHGAKPAADLMASVAPPEERQRIVVKKGSNLVILPMSAVHYIEAYDDYVKVHTKEGFYLKKKTMAHYEKVLDAAQFVRVHRSYLINLQELTRIEPLSKDTHVAMLKSGTRIPLSETGYAKLRQALGI